MPVLTEEAPLVQNSAMDMDEWFDLDVRVLVAPTAEYEKKLNGIKFSEYVTCPKYCTITMLQCSVTCNANCEI
ncbi:hypothetical protein EPA93_28595 [Ktedonosporobacter rubrisoli]|uniref:Uncharacterized protein n=1 Tax=Ktedonosporobacter rubrisoli TaxID=2509675 RepID=A0A4P6JWE0_KTERU|nr:hypothetical protein [Ktedonosporobacter rubrisoli]QBD79723.1 hypothetical protein EPA93_28595 [Ktedonosporobacter rubrisoli]